MANETTSNVPAASEAADTRHQHQVLTGRVTSAKMEKTIVVEVLRLVSFTRMMKSAKPSPETPCASSRRGRFPS